MCPHLNIIIYRLQSLLFFFFFNDTATTEIYTLPLHDALPIFEAAIADADERTSRFRNPREETEMLDRKSTRLNSSHSQISYAVFCLKKKKIIIHDQYHNSVLCEQPHK